MLLLLLVLLSLVLLFLIVKPSVEEETVKISMKQVPIKSLIKKFCHHSCASLFNVLWSVCTELCQSIISQLLYAIYISCWLVFKRQIFRTMTFCLQIHLWIDTRIQLEISLSFLCVTEGANQTINECHLSLLTGIESLTDRWVLSNTPIKTIHLQCFANGLNH